MQRGWFRFNTLKAPTEGVQLQTEGSELMDTQAGGRKLTAAWTLLRNVTESG